MEQNTHHNMQMVDHMISHLVSPYFIKDEQELQTFCNGAEYYPETQDFAVMVVHIERWSDILSTEAQWHETSKHHFFVLSNMLSELLNRGNISVVAEMNYQQVCIINLKESWEIFCPKLKQSLEHMLEVLETEFNISVTASISPAVHGLMALPYAYQCAVQALWYNEFLGKDHQILFYDTLCGDQDNRIASELTDLDKKLIFKLQSMDIPGVKYVLQEIVDREFIQSTPTVKILQARIGGISCKIMDALDEIRPLIGDEFYFKLDPAPRILEARNLTELTSALGDIFDSISQKMNATQQEPKPQWVDKMALYIQRNYTDESLGLTEVSAVFGITPSYATRVFKQYTGRGIYETIQHVRLSAAKDLFHTDLTMKQIAQAVGYTSFLSMNRAFKKYEGATPSQFRNQ